MVIITTGCTFSSCTLATRHVAIRRVSPPAKLWEIRFFAVYMALTRSSEILPHSVFLSFEHDKVVPAEMLRQFHFGRHSAFLANGRSFLQGGARASLSAAAQVGVGYSDLTSTRGCLGKLISSWAKRPCCSPPYAGSEIFWSYTQVRPCSRSESMETVISASGGSGGKANAAVGRWLRDGARFELTETCKLVVLRGDITRWHIDRETDAIVNAANVRMLGGGGVDGAIHAKAGPELKEACRKIPLVACGVRCPTGEARITRGFRLPVSRIIHTVGPIYDGNSRAEELLTNAYKNSCALAVQEGVLYIAFPAISCGIYGYPVEKAARTALRALKEGSAGLREVHFVLFDEECYYSWMEEARYLKKI